MTCYQRAPQSPPIRAFADVLAVADTRQRAYWEYTDVTSYVRLGLTPEG